MKPLWAIQEDIFAEDNEEQKLLYTLQELDMEIVKIEYIADEGTKYNLPPDRPVIFHGSLRTIQDFQKRVNNCRPFAWCDFEKLSCRTYYAHYGKHLLQQLYGFYPLREISRLKDTLYKIYGKDDVIFIRPDANNKTFTGSLIKRNMFNSYFGVAADYDQKPDTLCVVARPERIHCEWRFVVADQQVITGSQYMDGNARSLSHYFPKSAADFVEVVVKDWQPHPLFVVDVAATDNGYKVVEIGMLNAAGFYHCNLRTIVKACAVIAEREFLKCSKRY